MEGQKVTPACRHGFFWDSRVAEGESRGPDHRGTVQKGNPVFLRVYHG